MRDQPSGIAVAIPIGIHCKAGEGSGKSAHVRVVRHPGAVLVQILEIAHLHPARAAPGVRIVAIAADPGKPDRLLAHRDHQRVVAVAVCVGIPVPVRGTQNVVVRVVKEPIAVLVPRAITHLNLTRIPEGIGIVALLASRPSIPIGIREQDRPIAVGIHRTRTIGLVGVRVHGGIGIVAVRGIGSHSNWLGTRERGHKRITEAIAVGIGVER